jgi:hypothetical protein
MKKLISLVLLTLSVSACTSFDMAPYAEDQRLKEFIAPQEKAGVYIFRNELKGNILIMDVDIDGQHLGRTQWETYLYRELTPGKHIITSRASNVDSIEVELKAGTLTYVWQEVVYGLPTARSKLHIVNKSKGQKGVLESELSGTK